MRREIDDKTQKKLTFCTDHGRIQLNDDLLRRNMIQNIVILSVDYETKANLLSDKHKYLLFVLWVM